MLRFAPAVVLLFVCACGNQPPTKAEAMTALQNGKLLSGSPEFKEIAFTFDDGPKPGAVEPLIQELERLNVRATFFLVGQQAKEFPELVRLIKGKGHQIANHSYTHPNLTQIPLDAAEKELVDTEKVLRDIIGEPVIYWRPPGGNYNSDVLDRARKHKYVCVFWTINTADYLSPGPEKTAKQVLDQAKPGSIVLMHTGVPGTVQALEKIVGTLRSRGYKFVTVAEMADKMR